MSEVNIPILIANFKPFRLISRDGSDLWEPSLEEINSSTYDYVKLHRASKFFNAHLPKLMPACFGFDGSLIFPFITEFKNGDLVVEEVNRILASVFLGGIYVESISPLDVSRGSMNITGYYRHSSTHSSNSDFHQAIGECDAGSLASIKLLHPEVLEADKVISAYNYGHKVLLKLPTLSPSLFIGAFTYYKKHQLREALAHSWIGVEQILEFIWKETIVEDTKSVNIPKRRKFIESQQWNAAHKIEMLYQQSLIKEDLYSFLSKARFARNNFIHKGLTPSYEETHSALI